MTENPYIGPRAFRVGERLPNREREAKELANLVMAERIVLLHAPSGAGKTSLIQTSVTKKLREEGFAPTEALRVECPRPDTVSVPNRYVFSLALNLLGGKRFAPAQLARMKLPEVLAHATGTQGRRVLVIDQLEEILTLDPTDVDVKTDFFRQLGEAIEKCALWTLLAIREDHLGGLDRYLRFLPTHIRVAYGLDFLRRPDALAAIKNPKPTADVFTSRAANALADKLTVNGWIEPFQLQVVCRQVWQDWDRDGPVDLQEFKDDDISRALAKYYSRSMGELVKRTGVSERVVRDWFERELIKDTKWRTQTMRGPDVGDVERDVLKRLEDMYLIRSDTRGGTRWYELAHDRLVGAVLEDNQGWQLRNLPTWQVAAYEWDRRDRHPSFLLPKNKLAYAPLTFNDLPEHERRFLELSYAAARSEVKDEVTAPVTSVPASSDTEDSPIEFNGLDPDTGRYLFPALSPGDIAEVARREDPDSPFLRAMQRRSELGEATLGAASFVEDLDDLAQTGWGVVMPEDVDPRIIDALRPLLNLRRDQAGEFYREMVVRPGEDKSAFLRRHKMGPGPADPRRVPYYLLIVGPPTAIPFAFQYLLDVQYAVGRIDFDTVEEYAAYARVAKEAEERTPASLPMHLFGTRNPGDRPTKQSATKLIEPLAQELSALAPGIRVTTDVGARAGKQRLTELLATGPAVLFTATHGLGRPKGADREIQGALVCQDWPGPLAAAPITPDQYLSAADITGPVAPRVVFSFACYSGGFPADPFTARLPQRLLTRGTLAFVGHIDRAWGYSFLWTGADNHITAMVSTLLSIHKGHRIGRALEDVNLRWSEIAAELTIALDRLQDRGIVGDRELAWSWTASNDARNYVLLGDPAVRAC
ncbi:ATP-binding protein [Amycolatopsis sp. NPDC049691]|uniref:ATP-binding protein n=1 Tax=Amycolatopsis sp. NPDC049691 TaxID=3155155 RepID=UPI00342C3C8F